MAIALLCGCSSSGSQSSGQVPSGSRRSFPGSTTTPTMPPTTIPTTTPAMTRQAAQQATPSNLTDQAIPSAWATDLPVGGIGFTDIDESEVGTEPAMPLLKANGQLCISWGMKVWSKPGAFLDHKKLVQVDAAVQRTGTNSFTVAVPPQIAPTARLAADVKSCSRNPKTTLVKSGRLVALVGYPGDISVGHTRYIPGGTVWVAGAESMSGYLLATSSRTTQFNGSVAVTMTPKGPVVHANPSSLYAVGKPQIAEIWKDDPNSFPKAHIIKISY